MSDINFFAKTDYRGEGKAFGIKREDRRLHMYVIGRTGMGKTTLLLNMILNDIYGGEGVCFIDPHGDAVETLLNYIPAGRVEDVIYFNPADTEHPVPLNVLEQVPPERRHLLVSSILSIFRKLYPDHWQHRQEHILRNCLLALLENGEDNTLVEVHRLLVDWRYRKAIADGLRDPIVKSFWKVEFPRYLYQYKGEALAPIQNKLGAFLTAPLVRNMVGQKGSGLNFREVMDRGQILLVNLAKGRLGEDIASFFGALIIVKLQLTAMTRIELPEITRRDFFLFVDEFQSFVASDGLDTVLSEARKYRLCLTLAHQYIGQLDEELRQAIFGNVGTVVAFPVGPEDAEILGKEFYPEFNQQDLVDHAKHHIYLRLAIDGKTSRPFSAVALPPFSRFQPQGHKDRAILLSRKRFPTAKVSGSKESRDEAPRQAALF